MLSSVNFARLAQRLATVSPASAAPRRSYQYNQRGSFAATKPPGEQIPPKYTVDLRSDVLSKPSQEMMLAMMDNVSYGDDVFVENTTVNDLEARAAKLLGKEAGLFLYSGTQGNLLSMLTFGREMGSEVIMGDRCHMHLYEQGSLATLARVHHRAVRTKPDGTLCLEECRALVRMSPNDPHFPLTRALCLENTHAYSGGKVLPLKYCKEAKQFAEEHGMKLYVDGARLFNAALAANVEPIEYAKYTDAMTFSFCKGLGAPVGSCLVGDAETIRYCRKYRKALGGGARQPGMLAAVANRALDNPYQFLKSDQENAMLIYTGLSRLKLPGWISLVKPESNIVVLNISRDSPVDIGELQSIMEEPTKECPILLKTPAMSEFGIRMVTHNDVSREACERVAEKVASVLPRLVERKKK